LKLSRAPRMISSVLAVGGRSGAPLSKRAGQWLIAIEVALALVLMAGAGLIVRSFAKLVSVDLGFDTANVLTLEVEPLEDIASGRRDYSVPLAETLRRLPEVVAAGAINDRALSGGNTYSSPILDTGERLDGPERTVLPGYLEAMGIRPLAGRLLAEEDRATAHVVILNAAASR